jgi:transposase-like protein
MAAPKFDPHTRAQILRLVEEGIATVAELARLLDVSRQTIQKMSERAGIDPISARAEYVRRAWKEHGGRGK